MIKDKIDSARDSGMSYRELEKTYGVPKSSLSYRYGNGKKMSAEDTVHSSEHIATHKLTLLDTSTLQ